MDLISLDMLFFGNTLLQYGLFFASIFSMLILGKIVLFFIQRKFKKMVESSDTKLDDLIIITIEKPIYLTFLVAGVFIGLSFLNIDSVIYPTIEKILITLFYVNVVWYLLRFSDNFLEIYIVPYTNKSKSKLDDQLLPILKKTVKYSIIILALLIIMDNIGFDITTLIAGLGIGGLAIAMASQDAISNIFGGITIFTDKPFVVGDWIKIDKHEGVIEEVGIRSSRLRTFDGALITLPNNMFSKSPIENISMRPTERVVSKLGLTYNTSNKKMGEAKSLIKDILKKTKGINNKIFYISFVEFGEFSLKLLITYYITDMSSYDRRLEIKDEINTKIKDSFEKSKIEMAFPTQMIYHQKL